MPSLDAMTVNLKINPEMTDEAKAILRDMIVTELKAVFPDTIKPFELLREEMHKMVKQEVDAYFQHSTNVVRTQVVGRKHVENTLTDKEMLDKDIARMQDPRYKNTR